MNRRDPDADLDFDALARLAANGDRVALAELVRGLQHPTYRLALRFLGHPQDAEDATQEILIRVGLLVDALPEISRIRLNPVLVSPDAAWVIDARIHVAPASRRVEELRRL